MNCEICTRPHEQPGRRTCHPCQHRLAGHLDQILNRCADAATSIQPTQGKQEGSRGKPGSRPR